MQTINYISNISLSESSGGGSGINYAMYQQMAQHFNINLFPINDPRADNIKKIQSKISRILGFQGNYHYYSENRLKEYCHLFIENDQPADFYYFHGFTRWIKTQPNKPYYCFNDACFATYVEIYNKRETFLQGDLKRIYRQEAKWLENASKVFFRSRWAMEATMKHYGLAGENFLNVGVGGFIEIPEADSYQTGLNFLFISREFVPKGGLVVARAFRKVHKLYPDAKLTLVGDRPPENVLEMQGIIYKGFLNKNVPEEREKLNNIFMTSFALLHPTVKDTNTLVITELAYFGCPAISTNDFAIPEYLLDGKTGLLIDDPQSAQELTEKMIFLIEKPEIYKKMRIDARRNAINYNTWKKVGERIVSTIRNNR